MEERRGTAGPVRAGFVNLKTALRRETCAKIRRGKECRQAFPNLLIASPSFHGGRGALPSAGGHPADLTFLAGGGCCYQKLYNPKIIFFLKYVQRGVSVSYIIHFNYYHPS